MAKVAKKKAAKGETEVFEILRLRQTNMKVYLLGTTPLMMNRMTAKAKQQLLLGGVRKNRAALEANQKHNPPEEYRDCTYKCADTKAPTLFHFPNNAFKKAMAQAAVDTPGAAKAQIGRLVSVKDPTVHIYGKSYLHMGIVRQGGIQKTPDVRTRAIFPEWACSLTVTYISSILKESDVLNLLASAGMITGIGDGRTEKGTFDFGQWEVVGENDKRWLDIVKKQGRKVQEECMMVPTAYDADAEELLAWYEEEVVRREFKKSSSAVEKEMAAANVAMKAKRQAKRGNGKQVGAN